MQFCVVTKRGCAFFVRSFGCALFICAEIDILSAIQLIHPQRTTKSWENKGKGNSRFGCFPFPLCILCKNAVETPSLSFWTKCAGTKWRISFYDFAYILCWDSSTKMCHWHSEWHPSGVLMSTFTASIYIQKIFAQGKSRQMCKRNPKGLSDKKYYTRKNEYRTEKLNPQGLSEGVVLRTA